MFLGRKSFIRISSNVFEKSLEFYKKLNFHVLEESENYAFITDGIKLFQLINSDEKQVSLVYLVDDLNISLQLFQGESIQVDRMDSSGFVISDPEGFKIEILQKDINCAPEFKQEAISHLGRFFDISFETENYDSCEKFYFNVGFRYEEALVVEPRWCGLTDDVMRIGIYESGSSPYPFDGPAFFYYEPDMNERISRVKSLGLPIIDEFRNEDDIVNEAILETPEGLHILMLYFEKD